MSYIGTSAFGLRMPIIKAGDNIVELVVNQLKAAAAANEYHPKERDIIALTESIVARAKNKYVTVDQVAESIKKQLVPSEAVFLYNPIFSRNRFSIILKAFARVFRKVYIVAGDIDEVGNDRKHPITKIDYADFYREICAAENSICIWSENPVADIEQERQNQGSWPVVVDCTLHPKLFWRIEDEAHYTGYLAFAAGTCEKDVEKYRYNYTTLRHICQDVSQYGLLGSNKASEEVLKLFPDNRDKHVVLEIQEQLKKAFNLENVDVMIYGDGCYKDADTGIYELADPCVSPAYTDGLRGMPAEVKLKYLADDKFKDLKGEELENAIKKTIRDTQVEQGTMISQGTTARRVSDLCGSLCDLVSASGSKGTPVVVIQGYFRNYTDD